MANVLKGRDDMIVTLDDLIKQVSQRGLYIAILRKSPGIFPKI